MSHLQKRIKELSNQELTNILFGLDKRYSNEEEIVFQYALSELEERMPVNEFINICNQL